MSRSRKIAPFLLVLIDDENRRFTVIGPISDDTSWNSRVCKAQDEGRQVRCFTPSTGQTREQVVVSVQSELNLTYTEEVFI
jgi:hypothetical protein